MSNKLKKFIRKQMKIKIKFKTFIKKANVVENY